MGREAQPGAVVSDVTYKVVRVFYRHAFREVISTGMTLEEAQAHCSDDETSSSTARSDEARERTKDFGDWMDVFFREVPS